MALREELSRPVCYLQENTDGKGLNFCPELELSVWKIPAEMACVRGLSSSDFLQRGKKKSKSLELIDLCAQDSWDVQLGWTSAAVCLRTGSVDAKFTPEENYSTL